MNLNFEDMVAITDHIGVVSGTQEDKSGLITVLRRAQHRPDDPGCKVTMEGKLIDHVKLPTHDLFVGEIVGTYAERQSSARRHRRHRQAQAAAVRHGEQELLGAGQAVAKCWSIGKEYTPKG